MNSREAIFRRKSVRKYINKSISQKELDFVKELIEKVPRLYPEIGLQIELIEDGTKIHEISHGFIGSYGKIESPHYLVVKSEEKDGYLENVGYTLEEIVLELADKGIGTCWIGGTIKKDLLKNVMDIKESHKPIIVIALGYPERKEDLDIKNIHDYRRKELDKIIIGGYESKWEDIFNQVRIAPSAVNFQPWGFYIEDNSIKVFSKEGNIITKKILHFSDLDTGIALKHLELACKESGMDINYKKEPKSLKGYKYILTVELS